MLISLPIPNEPCDVHRHLIFLSVAEFLLSLFLSSSMQSSFFHLLIIIIIISISATVYLPFCCVAELRGSSTTAAARGGSYAQGGGHHFVEVLLELVCALVIYGVRRIVGPAVTKHTAQILIVCGCDLDDSILSAYIEKRKKQKQEYNQRDNEEILKWKCLCDVCKSVFRGV